jgi:hypothetical protein
VPRIRDIVSVVRAAAVWLLVMSVLLGPVGIGAASAIGWKAWGVSCPCDGTEQLDHDDCDEPCADEENDGGCVEDCPSCGCGAGVALATAAVLLIAAPESSPDLVLTPSDAPAIGVSTGVFRPPRSLV